MPLLLICQYSLCKYAYIDWLQATAPRDSSALYKVDVFYTFRTSAVMNSLLPGNNGAYFDLFRMGSIMSALSIRYNDHSQCSDCATCMFTGSVTMRMYEFVASAIQHGCFRWFRTCSDSNFPTFDGKYDYWANSDDIVKMARLCWKNFERNR